eukprot:264595-Amphidinium_carterae.1
MPDHSDPGDSMAWEDQNGATVYIAVPMEKNAQMRDEPVESVSTPAFPAQAQCLRLCPLAGAVPTSISYADHPSKEYRRRTPAGRRRLQPHAV